MKAFPSLLFLTVALALDATAGKPNIGFLLADDLGVGSVNCCHAATNLVRTPNMDRLAREGRRFTDANTPSSVCSPTRYAVLTPAITSQMTVTEITYGVGFSDLKHFRSVFREQFGVLPGDYSKRSSGGFVS